MTDKYIMPTRGEALFEVHGLVNEEVSRLLKSQRKEDKIMAQLLTDSMSVILFACN